MPTCINLSRLPPAPSHVKSVNFRNTTPGSVKRLLNPAWARTSEFDGQIDPAHPAARMARSELLRKLPVYKGPHFDMKVFPKAALARPAQPWPSPPRNYAPDAWPGERRVNVSLNMLASIKPSNNQVVRRKIRNKVRTAVHLLVTRSPVVSTDPSGEHAVKWGNHASANSVLQDWTYLIYARPAIYSLPYPTLIHELKRAFSHLLRPCQQLQQSWEMQYPAGKNYLAKVTRNPAKHVMGLLQSSLPAEVLEQSQEFIEEIERPTQDAINDDWKTLLRDISADLERGEVNFDEELVLADMDDKDDADLPGLRGSRTSGVSSVGRQALPAKKNNLPPSTPRTHRQPTRERQSQMTFDDEFDVDEILDMDFVSSGATRTRGPLSEVGPGTVADFVDVRSSSRSPTVSQRRRPQPRREGEEESRFGETSRPKRNWQSTREAPGEYSRKGHASSLAPQDTSEAKPTPAPIKPLERLFKQKPILTPRVGSKNKR